MKSLKTISVAAVLLGCISLAMGQDNPDTSYWSHSGKVAITFSQVGLSNWSGGGDPSVSFNGIINYNLKYEKDPHLWQTIFDAGYGMQRIGKSDEPFKKTDDNLTLVSRYGYKIGEKWYLSALADFRTQFYEGLDYETDPATFISDFFAPAYLKLGLGVTYNHSFAEDQSFSMTFTPVNGRMTIVMDDTLSAHGEYGVEPGENILFMGGMDLMLALKKELVKNVSLSTMLSVFTPYSDFGVAYVNWDLSLWFKINEFFSANISTQLIYDQDVTFTDDAGNPYNSAVQFKEVLGIGFTYSF
jgi:hypothetical protein